MYEHQYGQDWYLYLQIHGNLKSIFLFSKLVWLYNRYPYSCKSMKEIAQTGLLFPEKTKQQYCVHSNIYGDYNLTDTILSLHCQFQMSALHFTESTLLYKYDLANVPIWNMIPV